MVSRVCESPPLLLGAFLQSNIHQHGPLLLSATCPPPTCSQALWPQQGGCPQEELWRRLSFPRALGTGGPPGRPPLRWWPTSVPSAPGWAPPLSPIGTLPVFTPDLPPDNTRPSATLGKTRPLGSPGPGPPVPAPSPPQPGDPSSWPRGLRPPLLSLTHSRACLWRCSNQTAARLAPVSLTVLHVG